MTRIPLTAAVGVFALLSAVPAFAQQNITALQSVPIEIGSSFVVTDGCIINGDDSSVTMDLAPFKIPLFWRQTSSRVFRPEPTLSTRSAGMAPGRLKWRATSIRSPPHSRSGQGKIALIFCAK